MFDTKIKQQKMTCRNWESGVLIPVISNNVKLDTRSENGEFGKESPRSAPTSVLERKQEADVSSLDSLGLASLHTSATKNELRIGQIETRTLSDVFTPLQISVPISLDRTRKHIEAGTTPWFFKGTE